MMTEQEIKALVERNKRLEDEVKSLWDMLDEIHRSDIENYSELIKGGIENKILEMKMLSATKLVKA
jgi:uncharacterized protein (UPF0335 family)